MDFRPLGFRVWVFNGCNGCDLGVGGLGAQDSGNAGSRLSGSELREFLLLGPIAFRRRV